MISPLADSKFWGAFIPAFLSTGVALGSIYVIAMRSLNLNREAVEAWFEKQRKRLKCSVPIIQTAQPVMIGVLYAIYGRRALRRLGASFFVAALFTLTIFSVVYWRYRHLPSSVHLAGAQLEREVDPVLYKYVTDPELQPEYKKSQMVFYNGGGPQAAIYVVYQGQPYNELRRGRAEFQRQLFSKIYSSPLRMELILLFIMKGTYIDPGFQWLNSIFIFAFNVLLDFVSVTIVVVALRLLGRNTSFLTAAGTFAFAVCGTLMCLVAALFSYRLFFRGNINIFGDLFALPMASVTILLGVIVVVEWLKRGAPGDRGVWFIVASFAFFISFATIWRSWSELHSVSLDLVNFRDLFSVPFVLAGTTLVPAILS